MIELPILRNTEKAPDMGSRFGQDVEAAGLYVIHNDLESRRPVPGWVAGTAWLSNPLYVDVDTDSLIEYKRDLAKKYKSTGKNLTDKLIQAGYDALVTQYPNGDMSEIVLFPNAKYSFQEDINPGTRRARVARLISLRVR